MRRWAMIARLGFSLLLLLSESGCGWLSFRRREPQALRPQEMARLQQLSEQAQSAIDHGDLQTAQLALQQLLVLDPQSADATLRLGKVLQLQERFAEAEGCFKRALELGRDYPEALIGLGQMEARRGDVDSALRRLHSAIELDPNQPEAHLEQGRILESLGRVDEAIAAYFRASELQPNHPEITLRIGAIQLAQSQAEQALVRLDQAVELAPENVEARLLRGRANLQLQRMADAIDDLRFATSHLPDRPETHYYLALALEADNKRSEALRSAEKALKLAPDYTGARDLTTRLRR